MELLAEHPIAAPAHIFPAAGTTPGLRATSILHWTMKPGQRGPYELRLVKTTTWHDAAELLAPLEGGRVKECTHPELLRQSEAHPDNEVWPVTVEQIPSVYDAYSTSGSGWQRMLDDGFDPS